jgi:hypothetical protein
VTTKVTFKFILELLNAQRPLGKGESAASYANVGTNLERTGGAPPNWRSKASRIKKSRDLWSVLGLYINRTL